MFLAGDVGGTKVRLALFERDGDALVRRHTQRWESRTIACFEEHLATFLRENDVSPEWACIGIPGPVHHGEAKLTNLPWILRESEIAQSARLPGVTLVNDLAATAAALPLLSGDSLELLHQGERGTKGPLPEVRCVLAPGTGLGQSFLVTVGDASFPLSSEGGHVDFAPTDEIQDRLLVHLRGRFGRVSAERLLCGPGLVNIYEFLREEGVAGETEAESRGLTEGDAPSAIARAAKEPGARLSREAMRLFVRCLYSHAGNIVLTYMATGGVYLGGGIPPKIVEFLRDPELRLPYTSKGRLSAVVERTPLSLIKDDHAALVGAASIAAFAAVRR